MIWVLDIIRWMETYAHGFTGERVLARARELGGEHALVVSLRIATDVNPDALPSWAREQAERLPHGRPLMSRVIYPDLSAGRRPSPFSKRLRSFLFADLPGLGFRPIRLLELLLPKFKVPLVASPPSSAAGVVVRLLLGLANVLAIVAWKLKEWRRPRTYSTFE